MEIIRFSCYLFTFLQLVEIAISKSVRGKGRSSSLSKAGQRASAHHEKAVYGQIYEDTKNDVNRAIENAILEASKKATDMVLDPKVQSKLVDQVTSHAVAGEEENLIEKTTKPPQKKKNTRKHTRKSRKESQEKAASKAQEEAQDGYEDAAGGISSDDTLQKTAFKEEDKEVPGHINEDDEADFDAGSTIVEPQAVVLPAPKGFAKSGKKKKATQYDDELNVIDVTDSSGNSEEESADDAEADADVKSEGPPQTEAKDDEKTAPAEGKDDKEEKEGQEDLKQLLDESITNLIKANSAVEVLLRATNMRQQADLQQYLKNKCGNVPCARTSAPAIPQPVPQPAPPQLVPPPQPVPQPPVPQLLPEPAEPVEQPFQQTVQQITPPLGPNPATCARCFPSLNLNRNLTVTLPTVTLS